MELCKSCGKQYANENDYLKDTSNWHFCDKGNLWFNCKCKNIMSLSKGKFNWYAPEKVMDIKTASLFNKLTKKNTLPYIPNSIMKIQLLLSDENSSSTDFVNAIKTDPVLAAEILTTANNMKIGSGQKIESLAFAFSYIGRDLISQITMLAAIKSFKFNTKKFQSKNFWITSRMTGQLTEFLSKKFKTKYSGDICYISGSLCNIGKAVSAIGFPTMTDIICDKIQDLNNPKTWIQVEKELDANGHILLGELACTIWGFPDYVKEAISDHHKTANFDKKDITIGELSALANQMSHLIFNEDHLVDQAIINSMLIKLKLNEAEFQSLVQEASFLD